MAGSDARPIRLAFFGHNANEPAVRRRAQFFARADIAVTGVMPYRGAPRPVPFPLHSLGETRDNSYMARLRTVRRAAKLSTADHNDLRDLDVIYARNLDMLACAHAFARRNRLRVPIVYECLDIHRLMIGNGAVATGLRRIEGKLLARSALLVCSSPQFIDQYFARYHAGKYRALLVENRVDPADVGPRPNARTRLTGDPMRIGWIGNLRCRRSLDLLCQLVEQFHPRLTIHIHGYPARHVFPDFEQLVANRPGLHYFGPYNGAPELARIYGDLDMVWAADWFEAGHNSVWQIPNRIYEGGYFGVPAITAEGTETARMTQSWGAGWRFADPPEATVPPLIDSILRDPTQITRRRDTLLSLPTATFAERPEDTRAIIAAAL